MHLIKTVIPDCYLIGINQIYDKRGFLLKTFKQSCFNSLGLCTDWQEQFYTYSDPNVIRGLHFQLPPYDHFKLIYCITGLIYDVVLDLRVGSPAYRKHITIKLGEEKKYALYLPPGVAHGFCTVKDPAIVVYNVSTEHEPTSDSGIRWDSAGIEWPIINPNVSERDQNFISFENYKSPFVYLENIKI
jgi:dTDP-4-dehydrorhamnose 3,5-epimerase